VDREGDRQHVPRREDDVDAPVVEVAEQRHGRGIEHAVRAGEGAVDVGDHCAQPRAGTGESRAAGTSLRHAVT